MRYGDEIAAPPGPEPEGWAKGEFQIETLYLGEWRLDHARGRFGAQGATVTSPEMRAMLYGGSVTANGSISLAEEDAAPFRVDLEAVGVSAADAGPVIGLQEGTLTGVAAASGRMEGRLSAERLFLEDARVALAVTTRDGSIGNTPRTMMLARLANPLGWRGLLGRPLPYDTITLGLQIENGRFHTEDFSLEGPELRALAAGESAHCLLPTGGTMGRSGRELHPAQVAAHRDRLGREAHRRRRAARARHVLGPARRGAGRRRR